MSKVVAIVPARSGSVRLPGKNKMILVDKPMICYTIIEALKCSFIDEIIVTTDDEDIIELIAYNYPSEKLRLVRRPEYLATPDTDAWAVVEHTCQGYSGSDIIIYLQPTSPLRDYEDINKAWMLFNYCDYKFGVVSGTWKYPDHNIRINGAIYIYFLNTIINTKSFMQQGVIMFLMPYDRSIDIDDMHDFLEAERLLLRRREPRHETTT